MWQFWSRDREIHHTKGRLIITRQKKSQWFKYMGVILL